MRAIVCINTSLELCKERYQVVYDGLTIEIERWAKNSWHQLRAECVNDDYNIVHEKIRRFLSEICRLYNCEVTILNYWWATNKNTRFEWPYQHYHRIWNGLSLADYQQIASNETQKVALWIYREAMSSKSIFYEFLCYARIINLVSSDWKQQVVWINNNMQYISAQNKDEIQNEVDKKFQQDPTQPQTMWDHLYVSWRCAIAHASPWLDKVADSDNFEDYNRIYRDLEVVRELAKLFINKELKVFNRKELSALQIVQRFQNHYWKEIIDKIINGEGIDIQTLPPLPLAYIRLRWLDYDFVSFKDIQFKLVSIDNASMVFTNEEQWSPSLTTWFMVDFRNSEMIFDVEHLYINDEKLETEKRLKIDYLTFLKHYFKNGTLEIVQQDNNQLITRSKVHMFVNADINAVRAFCDKIDKDLSSLGEAESA